LKKLAYTGLVVSSWPASDGMRLSEGSVAMLTLNPSSARSASAKLRSRVLELPFEHLRALRHTVLVVLRGHRHEVVGPLVERGLRALGIGAREAQRENVRALAQRRRLSFFTSSREVSRGVRTVNSTVLRPCNDAALGCHSNPTAVPMLPPSAPRSTTCAPLSSSS
jgi:hypothetical protein